MIVGRTPALALGLLALAGSCVSFRTASTTPREPILEKLAFCASVDESPEALKPSEPKISFAPDAPQVCCWIQARIVPGPLTLRWKWYSPDKALRRDTGEVEVETRSSQFNSVSAFDRIIPGPEALATGDWTVVIFLNGHLAGRGSFRIG